MNETQLIAEWLKTNQPSKHAEADKVYVPYSKKLIPTNTITKIELDPKSKKRIYRFLGKTPLSESLDESTKNYGY